MVNQENIESIKWDKWITYETLFLKRKILIEKKDFKVYETFGSKIKNKNSIKVNIIFDDIITNLIKAGWNEKDNILFYRHNFFSFDSLFLLRLFINKKINLHKKLPIFILEDENILADVKSKIPNKFYKITLSNGKTKFIIKCSYKITNISLKKLTKDFYTGKRKRKIDFPHSLIPYLIIINKINKKIKKKEILKLHKHFNFIYKYKKKNFGSDITIFDNIEPKGYIFWKKNFNLLYKIKKTIHYELIKYAKNDALILTNSFINFINIAFITINIKIKKIKFNVFNPFYITTASRLRLSIYLNKFKKKNIFSIIKKNEIYNLLSKTYYGGICQDYSSGIDLDLKDVVYEHDFKNAYINRIKYKIPISIPIIITLKKDLCIKKSNEIIEWCKKNNYIFYSKCKIIRYRENVRSIPYKIIQKSISKIIFPIGKWEGFYNSNEVLEYLGDNKYNNFYIIKDTIILFKMGYPLSPFTLYNEFKKTISTELNFPSFKNFFKLVGNSLYGKLGSSPDDIIFSLNSMNTIGSYYIKSITLKETYFDDNLIIIGSRVKYNNNKDFIMKNISSLITCYTRIGIIDVNLLLIYCFNTTIIYNDTDRVYFRTQNITFLNGKSWNQDINKNTFSEKKHIVVFGPKTYVYSDKNNNIFLKAKGINSKEIFTIEIFKKSISRNIPLISYDNIKFITVGTIKKIDFATKILIPHSDILKRNFKNKNKRIRTHILIKSD